MPSPAPPTPLCQMSLPHRPALTPRSLGISLFVVVVSALANVVFWFYPGDHNQMGPSSIPAQVVFLVLALGVVVFFSQLLVRREVLSKAEGVAVLFVGLLAAPLTNAQLWGYLIQNKMELIRASRYENFDAVPPALLPTGPNLAADLLASDSRFQRESMGNLRWDTFEGARQQKFEGVTLQNERQGEVFLLRIRVPFVHEGEKGINRKNPHFFTFLQRTEGLASASEAIVRLVHPEDGTTLAEARTSTNRNRPTPIQPEGFSRLGLYNIVFPPGTNSVLFEFVLNGPGALSLGMPGLHDAAAIETFYLGRELHSPAAYAALDETDRYGVLRAPPSPWSWQGVKLALGGIVPLAPWLPVLGSWLSFILLLAVATFALLCLVRRQWLINERYPFPLVRLWQQFLGSGDEKEPAFRGFFRNRIVLAGFILAFCWCGIRVAATLIPAIPNPTIAINVESYVQGPAWSAFWRNAPLYVSFLILAVAVYMELNILLSLVTGFFLFRLQLWAGESYGWNQQPLFPNFYEQIFAALFVYGLVVIFFLRRYLLSVARDAWAGRKSPDDVLSPRAAVLLLVTCLGCCWLWALATNLPVLPVFSIFLGLLLCSWLLAKFRAEAALPGSNIGFNWALPVGTASLLTIFPSIQWLGVDGAIFLLLTGSVFLLPVWAALPGAQIDLLEAGRQYSIRRWHLIGILALGLGLGALLGPGAYLTLAYSVGADNAPGTSGMVSFRAFTPYNSAIAAATDAGEAAAQPFAYSMMAYSGAVTAGTAILRQWFAGFWFHPVGIVAGLMPFMGAIWGTFLVAWVLRFTAVKIGGAVFVRERFLPFFAGVFAGALTVQILRSVWQFTYYKVTGEFLIESHTAGPPWLL